MAPRADQVAQVETLMLEYLQLGVSQLVSEQEMPFGRMELGTHRMLPHLADNMLMSLRYYIAGQKETASVDYPRDWWEALKLRFAPAWVVRRWPVRMTTFTVDAWRFWQNAPKMEGWKPEYRIVIPRPMSSLWSDK